MTTHDLRRLARDLLALLLPVSCPGCGLPNVAACPGCRATLAGPPRRREERAPRLDRLDGRPALPVWAVADYRGPPRRMVLAWKDRGRHDLTPVMTAAVAGAAARLAPALAAAQAAASSSGDPTGGATRRVPPLLVVPAPSTAAARRRRGEDLVATLAGAAAGALREAGVAAAPARALGRRRGPDQAGLGARQRAGNLVGKVHLRRRWSAVLPGRVVLLVDDVLTTGATLAACDDALQAAGARVLGGLTLAATPPPGRSPDGHRRVPSGAPGVPLSTCRRAG